MLVAINILTVIEVSFINPLLVGLLPGVGGTLGTLLGNLVTIFFLFRYGLIEVECREEKVALAGVFMPLRNRVMADMVGNLIEFEILLLFGLYKDYYY
jgi:hypothetical protein